FFPENYRIVQGDSYLPLDQAPREGSPADTVSRAEMQFFLKFFLGTNFRLGKQFKKWF
ncbi:Murein hydrolase activator NlpD, partial [Frankliniella fusca]